MKCDAPGGGLSVSEINSRFSKPSVWLPPKHAGVSLPPLSLCTCFTLTPPVGSAEVTSSNAPRCTGQQRGGGCELNSLHSRLSPKGRTFHRDKDTRGEDGAVRAARHCGTRSRGSHRLQGAASFCLSVAAVCLHMLTVYTNIRTVTATTRSH